MNLAEVEATFHTARELAPAARESFLRDLERRTPELASEVRSLLAADGSADWLDPPATLDEPSRARESMQPHW